MPGALTGRELYCSIALTPSRLRMVAVITQTGYEVAGALEGTGRRNVKPMLKLSDVSRDCPYMLEHTLDSAKMPRR